MGCGGTSNSRGADVKEVTIYGHILDNQTRTLMLSFDISALKYKFKEINHVNPEVKTMKDY